MTGASVVRAVSYASGITHIIPGGASSAHLPVTMAEVNAWQFAVLCQMLYAPSSLKSLISVSLSLYSARPVGHYLIS